MPAIEEIDNLTQQPPRGAKNIISWLKQDGNVLQVVECKNEVLSWVMYQVNRLHLEIVAIGVHPKHQRKGVGRFILEELVKKLPQIEKNRVACEVSDELTEAHLWLKACGFEAVRVEGSLIRFARRLPVTQKEKNEDVPVPGLRPGLSVSKSD